MYIGVNLSSNTYPTYVSTDPQPLILPKTTADLLQKYFLHSCGKKENTKPFPLFPSPVPDFCKKSGVHTSLLTCTFVASLYTFVASLYTFVASPCTFVASLYTFVASLCTFIASLNTFVASNSKN